MKVIGAKWTEDTNLIELECKEGKRFYHPSYISKCKCPCCGEESYWHGVDPIPDGKGLYADLPVAEFCLDEQSD